MLRGVNKQVVEVIDMQNEYFEKAILFVKAEKQEKDEQVLRQRAGEYVRTIRYTPRRRLGFGQVALSIAKLASAAAVGAVATGLLIR